MLRHKLHQSKKQKLIRLTKEVSQASVEKDAATLNRLMDDNFILYSVSNKSYRKAELIKLWTQKDDSKKSETSTPDEFEVNIFGTTAIIISTITDSETDENSKTTIIKTKAFDVWQKTKKGWRWIASRETLVSSNTN